MSQSQRSDRLDFSPPGSHCHPPREVTLMQTKRKTPKSMKRTLATLAAVPRPAPNNEAVSALAAKIAASIVPGQRREAKDQVVFAFRCDLALRDQIHAAAEAANLSATA